MPIVEKRYAEALAELSEKTASIDLIRTELGDFVKLITQELSLKNFIKDPQTTKEIKKKTINKILEGNTNNILVNFIDLLLDKGRIDKIQNVYKEFCAIADKKKNNINMTILTPFLLEPNQLEKIKEKYRLMYNASNITTDIIVSPELIGGIQVKIGDRLYDNSLSTKLKDLKEYLQYVKV